MATRRSRNLSRAMKATAPLSVDELRELDEWLHDRIEEAEADEEIPVPASRAVVEQRKTPTGTYRLELVKCGKPACKVCKAGQRTAPIGMRTGSRKAALVLNISPRNSNNERNTANVRPTAFRPHGHFRRLVYTTQSRFGSFTYKRFTVPQEVHRSAKRVSRLSLSGDHPKKRFFFSLQRRPGCTSPPPPEAETVRPLMSCEPPQCSHVLLGMDQL
jgi:hypothetical protein